ncbi:MAG: carbamoyltransferase HypF [Anaerolineales bacterium]|nr:carbamoyltransferase HypF [Anaerolineales bacterium]
MDAIKIRISGTVQGVGFRPFVRNLAARHRVCGWVCNTSGSVEIAAEGEAAALAAFTAALRAEAPPLARIDSLEWEAVPAAGYASFEIRASISEEGGFQPVAPDIAVCPDCERELFDPDDRRHLYPFINCTNCGPRLTIIRDIPYDRPRTSMAPFEMCPRCRAEYENPDDRRYHAQPVACPECGPRVWMEPGMPAAPGSDNQIAMRARHASPLQNHSPYEPLLTARRLLREGRIVAIRGMGGFHLACDAGNADAVLELRRRKHRSGKPFAVMVRDLAAAMTCCEIGDAERAQLSGREKPIVILRRKEGCPVVEAVAPGNGTLGVMLPYSPLHLLLMHKGDPVLDSESAPAALVMTSGNLSEEPIAIGNDEALARLGPLADAFLLHDREIIQRCDDSVVRVFGVRAQRAVPEQMQRSVPVQLKRAVPLRRSRGYAPAPVLLPFDAPPILAVGGELKNTFCLARGRYAFLSPHIGDMENAETLAAFEESVERYQRLFHTTPEIIAHDMHPGYLGTRWACDFAGGRKRIAVQHHHAHAAACLADNELSGKDPVIALAFDGTGYGPDGAIWGAEVLVADYRHYERAIHLEYLPLPGGDAAIRKPWRIAVGFAAALELPVDDLPFIRNLDAREVETVRAQAARGIHAPPVSSMGRLFDAVAALAGICTEIDYEAQGAIELEELARGRIGAEGEYPFAIDGENIRVRDLLAAVTRDVRAGESAGCIGARFHNTVRSIAVKSAQTVRAARGIRGVALSGGVWQNALFLQLAVDALQEAGFEVYTHRRVPANDGGLALGQAAVAAAMEA